MSLSFDELYIDLIKYDNIIFDLDGTLYEEIYYRKIAFGEAIRAVLGNNDEQFESIYSNIIKKYNELYYIHKILTQSAGFEPARAKPNRFQVYLLNHSDMIAIKIY